MKAKDNELLTRTDAGTPAGELMRRYWQPAALVEELEGERPLKPVRLLGENLVLFRDPRGRYGLLDRHCPHRGADLCYGRLEDDGLRCIFHGWLFDVDGRCLDQPAEPGDAPARFRHTAYPCREHNGIIFTYMGPGEPPAMPSFDCFVAPDKYTFAFKGYIDCNWLQALEVGIDPAHASFLHRFFHDENPAESYGKQFRSKTAGSDLPLTKLLREYERPKIDVEDTPYGFRIVSLRELPDDRTHVRVTNLVFPHAIVIPMSPEMTITQWHVPIDDERCYWYAIFTSFTTPVDKQLMREQRLQLYTLPDYIPRLNRSNNYGFDFKEQQTDTYTGMGKDINVHDQWAVESLGVIQDRTKEHLGKSDVAIVRYRRMLRKAIDAARADGELPLITPAAQLQRLQGPAAIDTITATPTWQQSWQQTERQRRADCPWAGDRLGEATTS